MYALKDFQHPLLSKDILDMLKRQEINSVLDFLKLSALKLSQITGLQFFDIITIRNNLTEKYSKEINGCDYLKTLKSTIALIPTKINNLDNLLDGGLRTKFLYEICGYSGSGKSYLCRSIILNLVQSYKQNILLIDTVNNLDATRLYLGLNKYSDVTTEDIAKKVNFITILNADDLINFLIQLKCGYTAKNYKFRILIIDSLPAIFNISNENQSNRYNVNVVSSLLKYMVNKYNLIIICVNLIFKWHEYNPDDVNNSTNNVTIALGQQWKFVPHIRLLIERINNDRTRHKITLLKSSNSIADRNCILDDY